MSNARTTLDGLTPGTWSIDPTHAEVSFIARHLMVSKVRGKFTEFTGTVEVAEQLADSVANVTIKTASVDTGTADRDGHLRSADFFASETYPEMTFVSTSFDGSTLVGDLTIKGIKKQVKLSIEFGGVMKDPWGNHKAGITVNGKINRTDFGLNWNAALETGGVLVSEEIRISCEFQLVRQS